MCGDDSVVLFRMHHFVRSPVPIPREYADGSSTSRPSRMTNDLLHVTDVLITDYSSVIYEFSLLEQADAVLRVRQGRLLRRPAASTATTTRPAPGKVCASFDELVKALAERGIRHVEDRGVPRENFDSVDTGLRGPGDRLAHPQRPAHQRERPSRAARHDPAIETLRSARPTRRTRGRGVEPARDDDLDQRMNVAVIFAGGIGARMNSRALPKQFLEIHGKPIIIHTLEHFEEHPDIDGIAIAILAE